MSAPVPSREAADAALREPRNIIERLAWLHGRKFYLAFFAGSSIFFVGIVGIWVVARVNADRGALVLDIVKHYFIAAAGIVALYTGGNTLIERAYAQTSSTTTTVPQPPPRASGVVRSPHEET